VPDKTEIGSMIPGTVFSGSRSRRFKRPERQNYFRAFHTGVSLKPSLGTDRRWRRTWRSVALVASWLNIVHVVLK